MAAWNARANEIFLNALEIAAPNERRAYVKSACAKDQALQQAVEALLKAHADAGSFLNGPARVPEDETTDSSPQAKPVALTVDSPKSERIGAVIAGRYKLLQQLGEGGMGTVWMAEQSAPVKRLVALKVIKAGMDSAQVISRFEAERQALAMMDHPNIAKVLDAGTTDSGRPYFVMELVKGVSITKYCDERRLSPRNRLALFIAVCHAVQHAHQKGIIHRDLKPSNVMVALYDGKPVPKVIDFGVAKAAGSKLTDKTLYTGFGAIVGTLEYMSPEQAELNQLDIDTRSDIYSLGVLLYELLTGSTPLDRKRLKQGALLDMLRLIREEEPPKPSARLSSSETLPTLSAQRQTEPAKLSKLMRGELDWIVMKALDKDRDRRYETATGLAKDIERYLSDEPVLAGPPSATYRLRKFVKRNKGRVLAGLAMALMLLAGTAVSVALALWAFHEANTAEEARAKEENERHKTQDALVAEAKERARAEQAEVNVSRLAKEEAASRIAAVKARDEAIDLAAREEVARKDAEEEKNRADKERKRAEQGEEAVQKTLTETQQTVFAFQVWRAAGLWQRDPALASSLLRDYKACPPSARDFTWHYYHRLCQTEKAVYPNPALQNCLAFSPNGKLLAVGCSYASSVLVWDFDTGRLLHRLDGHNGRVRGVVFSRDGKTLISGGNDGKIQRWDVATGQKLGEPLVMSGIVFGLALHRDGVWLAAAGGQHDLKEKNSDWRFKSGEVVLWNLQTGERKDFLRGNAAAVQTVAFSPDGKLVAGGTTFQGTVRVFEFATGKEYATFWSRGGWVHSVEFSPDSKLMAVGRADFKANLWNVAEKRLLAPFEGHLSEVGQATFSPNGKFLATTGGHTVRVWEVDSRWGLDISRELMVFNGYDGPIAFTPDGRGLIAEKGSNLVHLALPLQPEYRTLKYHLHGIQALAFSNDGRHLASASRDNSARLCDLKTGAAVNMGSFPDPTNCVAFAPDDRTVFIGATLATKDKTKVGQIARYEVKQGKLLEPWLGHAGAVTSLAVSAKHRLLASASNDAMKVWDLAAGKQLDEVKFATPFAWPRSLVFHPTRKLLAGYVLNKGVTFWDLEDGTLKVGKNVPLAALPPVGNDGVCVAFTPTGNTLVIQSGSAVAFFDMKSAKIVHQFRSETDRSAVLSFAITPDERTVALGRANRTIELWDAPSKQLRATLTSHVRDVSALAFSPDGRMLASGDQPSANLHWVRDGAIKLWNAAPPGPIGHIQPVQLLAFAPDGSRLLSSDGASYISWDPEKGVELGGAALARNESVFADQGPDCDLVLGRAPNAMWLKDARTGAELARREGLTPFNLTRIVEGNLVAVVERAKAVKFFDRKSLRPVKTCAVPGWTAGGALELAPNGAWLATIRTNNAAKSRELLIWNLETQQEQKITLASTSGFQLLKTLPNDRVLIHDPDGVMKIWDLATGKNTLTLKVAWPCPQMATSADGQTLATATMESSRRVVRVWNLTNGEERLEPLNLPVTRFLAMALTPDHHLLVATEDGTAIKFWPKMQYR